MQWHGNIRGLTLRLDRLKALGASAQFLQWWETGRPLNAAIGPQLNIRNHPSVKRHADWAEREWSRLNDLGEISFFPKGCKPPEVHINPCALLLKERPDADPNDPRIEQYKARLLCDFLRVQINERLPAIAVNYGSVDSAVDMLLSPECLRWTWKTHSSTGNSRKKIRG